MTHLTLRQPLSGGDLSRPSFELGALYVLGTCDDLLHHPDGSAGTVTSLQVQA